MPKTTHGGKRKGSGRKPGAPQMAVKMPESLVVAARAEKKRRAPMKASIPAILAEWCEQGRAGWR